MARLGSARMSGVMTWKTVWWRHAVLAGVCGLPLPAFGQQPEAAPAIAPAPLPATEQPWQIGIYPKVVEQEIVTAERLVSTTATGPVQAGPAEAAPVGTVVPVQYACPPARISYKDAYEQIPFSRAEYEANPGYRHEAAMELVFGAQRPTTIVKQTTPYFSRYPDSFRHRSPVFPYPASYPNRIDLNTYWHQQWYW